MADVSCIDIISDSGHLPCTLPPPKGALHGAHAPGQQPQAGRPRGEGRALRHGDVQGAGVYPVYVHVCVCVWLCVCVCVSVCVCLCACVWCGGARHIPKHGRAAALACLPASWPAPWPACLPWIGGRHLVAMPSLTGTHRTCNHLPARHDIPTCRPPPANTQHPTPNPRPRHPGVAPRAAAPVLHLCRERPGPAG
jgi:hypothetical protein